MNRLIPALALIGILVCSPIIAAAGDFGPLKTEAGETVGRGFVVGQQGQVIGSVDRNLDSVVLHVRDQKIPLSRRWIDDGTKISAWGPVDATTAANLKPFELTRQAFLRPRMQVELLALQSGGDTGKVAGMFAGAEGPGETSRWLIGGLPAGTAKPGSPLLNACGQIDGVVIVNDALLARRVSRPQDRPTHALAYPIDALRSVLRTEAGAWRVAYQDCREQRLESEKLSAQDSAASTTRSAELAAQEADRRARQAQEQLEEANRIAQEKEREAQRVAEALQRQQAAASAAAADLERTAAQAEAQRRMLWITAAASALALLLVTALLVRRQRQRRFAEQQRALAEEKARQVQAALAHRVAEDQDRRAVPDLLLSGSLPDGWKVALTVPAEALLADGGVLVGRNPPPPGLVINNEEVSRRHLRLRWNKDHVEVEDVGSTNGTMVDGKELKAGDRAVLNGGASLQLGELSLVVELRAR